MKTQVRHKINKNIEILKPLFWDYEWGSVVEDIDSSYVIARVLEIGNERLNIKLDDLFRLFQKKFGDYNTLIIKKAIIYFEDAENEPKFPLLKDVKWEKVKAFFIKKIKET
ncbi:MAG: hypothetical protein ACP5KG_12170 [Myxococcota bacterium]